MKKLNQQEVLIVLNSSFAQRQWCKDEEVNHKNYTPEEKLEEACSNGLMYELLPEVFSTKDSDKMYLWQVQPGFSFLQLELGELPLTVENEFSVNPHNFLLSMFKN